MVSSLKSIFVFYIFLLQESNWYQYFYFLFNFFNIAFSFFQKVNVDSYHCYRLADIKKSNTFFKRKKKKQCIFVCVCVCAHARVCVCLSAFSWTDLRFLLSILFTYNFSLVNFAQFRILLHFALDKEMQDYIQVGNLYNFLSLQNVIFTTSACFLDAEKILIQSENRIKGRETYMVFIFIYNYSENIYLPSYNNLFFYWKRCHHRNRQSMNCFWKVNDHWGIWALSTKREFF